MTEVHPDRGARPGVIFTSVGFAARFELALSAALDQCGEFVSEHRIVRPDGSAVWFELDD